MSDQFKENESIDFLNSLEGQISNHFALSNEKREICLPAYLQALNSFNSLRNKIKRKYWEDWESKTPNLLNADHMSTFLYLLSRSEGMLGHAEIATKLWYFNRSRHGIDIWFEVDLPEIFLFIHPLGTVLGRALFQDYLVVYQNCTVGSIDNVYPNFEGSTVLFSNVSILGNSRIGDNVIFGAGSLIVNENIPRDTIVTGRTPHLTFRENTRNIRALFDSTN